MTHTNVWMLLSVNYALKNEKREITSNTKICMYTQYMQLGPHGQFNSFSLKKEG